MLASNWSFKLFGNITEVLPQESFVKTLQLLPAGLNKSHRFDKEQIMLNYQQHESTTPQKYVNSEYSLLLILAFNFFGVFSA